MATSSAGVLVLSSLVAFCGLTLLATVQAQGYRPIENNVRHIREQLLYPFNQTYYKPELNHETRRVEVQFRFPLPFFGFYFNYSWVSLHGNIAFSDPPDTVEFPLQLPNQQWPQKKDQSFIGPFYVPAVKGLDDDGDREKELSSGVYYRIVSTAERMLQDDHDIQEAIRRDLHEGMIGITDFFPKHIIIVTWKNVTFEGSSDRKKTNTYQMVVTTDEFRTYAIFNYHYLTWVTTTASQGSQSGIGGKAAFVGFNAGNGTRAFEYHPYSQSIKLLNLAKTGFINNKPGRHAFRIDEQIVQGSCYPEAMSEPLLFMSPESGHMLGGTVINITGPCFVPNEKITLKYEDKLVNCLYRTRNIATCVTPSVYTAGYVKASVSAGSGEYQFQNKFYIENPMIATEFVWFNNRTALNELNVERFTVSWYPSNISHLNVEVSIALYGYREISDTPELIRIAELATSQNLLGKTQIDVPSLTVNSHYNVRDLRFGFIQVSGFTHGNQDQADQLTAQLWSRPIPLGWYFKNVWREHSGSGWPEKFCKAWEKDDARLNNFAYQVPRCPCTLNQALVDKGRYAPDFGCDSWGNTECYGVGKFLHCVRSGQPAEDGGGQHCCYGKDENLVMNVDEREGGIPSRSHPFGIFPYHQSTKVPGLSHWYHDWSAFFMCCMWQDEMSDGCYQFKWRRASQDCVGYQAPNASLVVGDPHIITFDNVQYTFNGKGEFALLNAHQDSRFLEVQGRFEQYIDEQRRRFLPATILSAVVMKDNDSSTVEVQLRRLEARWRYRMNVLVDKKYIYFDRPAQKIQSFKGVTVYTPASIRNQSHIVAMFQSGAGVEIIETNGYIAARVYVPRAFMNKTAGLMGNWTGIMDDDLMLPGGDPSNTLLPGTPFEQIHKGFGLQWSVTDEGSQQIPGKQSHFTHENGRSSSSYFEKNFRPIWDKHPRRNDTAPFTETDVSSLCGDGSQEIYQCRYDYIVTQNKELASATKFGLVTFKSMKANTLQQVVTCGALAKPMHGRKTTNEYKVGTVVKFECDKGYLIEGTTVRECYDYGRWSWLEEGKTRCTPETKYYEKKAGITTGVVLGVLVPCIIGGICLFGFIIGRSTPVRRSPYAGWKQSAKSESRTLEMQNLDNSYEKKRRLETEA